MVSTLTWVLAGVVAYTVVAMALRARGLLPSPINVSGPLTTIHTKRGRDFLDKLSAPRRFWRAWGNLGVGISLVVMAGAFIAVLFAGIQSATQPETQAIQNPQNVLVLPGVNEFLPLSAAPEIIFGLAVGLVVHEGGHGLLCRVEDIDIKSMGLVFLAFIPLGAFVEPDEDSRAMTDRGAQTRMFAAGVTNNFAISIVAFILLFGPVAGSIAVVDGVAVGDATPGSSAADAGIERGDVITHVEGIPVNDSTDINNVLAQTNERTVSIQLQSGERISLDRQLIITRAVPEVVSGIDLDGENPPQILAVNGTQVNTEADFHEALADRVVAEIETTNGTATMPVGAFVSQVAPDGPLATASAPTDGTPVIITHIGDQRVQNTTALSQVLAGYSPGDTATVVAYVDGERETYEVTFDENQQGDALVGVSLAPGTSGLTVDDLGIEEYPAEGFLQLLGGGGGPLSGLSGDTVYAQIQFMLISPFLSLIDPAVTFNFAGFTGGVENFYESTGTLGFLGGGVLVAANLLFWTAWVNFQLAIFNCIPSFPLDGGHILRASTESIAARLPVGDKRSLTTMVTVSITLLMVASLVLLLFGPQLLS